MIILLLAQGGNPFDFKFVFFDDGLMREESRSKFGDTIRPVESQDAMTAQPSPFPGEILQRMTTRIFKEIPLVTRVAYELTPTPPATIEFG